MTRSGSRHPRQVELVSTTVGRRPRPGAAARLARAAVEALEGRQLLTTVVVTSNADDVDDAVVTGPAVTLRQAVRYQNANGGGTITFAPTVTGRIDLAKELTVTAPLAIVGPGSDRLDVRGRPDSTGYRAFNINDGRSAAVTVSMSGLRISGGYAESGGAVYNAERLTLTDVSVVDNTARTAAACSTPGAP